MIPRVAHFIWLGPGLAWVYRLALASAVKNGGFERVVLHHDGALDADTRRELAELPLVELPLLDPLGVVESAGGAAFVDCYRELEAPAARANLLRMALLEQRGGVYLDTDTVTLRSFAALAAAGGVFCGEERLIFPGGGGTSALSRLRPSAVVRMAVRDLCRRLPNGHLAFRRIEAWYPRAVNNAVLGAEAGHPFLRDLIERAARLPATRRRARYALGTHLLQEVVAEFRGPGLRVLPTTAFFPLAPEISEHWFRLRERAELEPVLTPETLLVHWYASVRTAAHVARIDRSFVEAHAERQLFSALAQRALGRDA